MAFSNSPWCLAMSVSFAFATAAAISSSSHAQLYKWTDENGKVHYSDSVPPSAVDRARKEMSESGTVRKQIDRALTPEERRVAAEKAAEADRARIAREDAERKDKALLASFTSIEEYDRVRAREVAQLQAESTSFENRIYVMQTQRSELNKVAPEKAKPGVKARADAEKEELNTRISDMTRDRDIALKNLIATKERLRLERELIVRLFAEQAASNAKATEKPVTLKKNAK